MRPLFAALLIAAPAGPCLGQGFTHPPGVSPTITPAMLPAAVPALRGFPAPFVLPAPLGNPAAAPPFLGYQPYGVVPNLGFGVNPGYVGVGPLTPNYFPYAPFLTPNYGTLTPVVPFAPPLVGAPAAVPVGPTVDSPLTAQLTIEFPQAVTLTVDGQPDSTDGVKTDTGVVRTITTRPLKPTEVVTLKVSAEWTQGGKPVVWDREVTLGRGETARLKVARGFKKQ